MRKIAKNFCSRISNGGLEGLVESPKINKEYKIAILVLVLLVLVGGSYAFINIRLVGEKRQVINSDSLELILEEDNNNLTIENAFPIYDEVGMIQEPFTFRVVNSSNVPLNYIVRLIDITTGEKLDTSIVKYGLTKDGTDKIDFLSNLDNNQMDSGIISSKQTIHYSLRLWIDFNVRDNNQIAGKSLSYKVEVIAGQLDGTERNIVLDSVGGILDTTSKSIVIGELYGELPEPTKPGYNFLGWFNEKDEIIHEDSILDSSTEKLTAKWGVNQYTVTLNANGGTVSSNYKQISFNDTYGNLPIPTKGDSKFMGWYTSLTGGTKIESTTIMNTASNHTLYAHWKDPYTDNTSANRPAIKNELIPVQISNNGTVTKADTTEKWYDYNNQEWANAVILLDKTKNYSEGQVIPESNIESYFVWIPRYKYRIFNTGIYSGLTSIGKREQTIEIEFENRNTPISNGNTTGAWLTHPAFIAFNTDGIWVGKYETGYKGSYSKTSAEANSSDSSRIQIKPNVYSWRGITVGNAFQASYDYARNLESHMMKNTEWGAVAYLQHSKYGSRKSVRFNNNDAYLTGYASVIEPTVGRNDGINIEGNIHGTASNITKPYNTSIGYTASTTANITGIYDMSGGVWEYIMGNTKQQVGGSGITNLYNDFFTNSKWNQYCDFYNASSETSYNSRILGDATGEMGPFGDIIMPLNYEQHVTSWYDDLAYYAYPDEPWFARGGDWMYGSLSGIFSFGRLDGGAKKDSIAYAATFRLVLAP